MTREAKHAFTRRPEYIICSNLTGRYFSLFGSAGRRRCISASADSTLTGFSRQYATLTALSSPRNVEHFTPVNSAVSIVEHGANNIMTFQTRNVTICRYGR